MTFVYIIRESILMVGVELKQFCRLTERSTEV